MNTSKYMPYNSIAPIMIKNEEYPECPGFSGTGFFVKFNPHEQIFFITAKHCILNDANEKYGIVEIALEPRPDCTKKIVFSSFIFGKKPHEQDCEDVVVGVIDENNNGQIDLLEKRCLNLIHQDDVDSLLSLSLERKGKLRTIGFPDVPEKLINYDAKQATVQPRGFYGNLTSQSRDGLFVIENLNWKDNNGNLNGFSGSPVIELVSVNSSPVAVLPVGIILTGSNDIAKFTSINTATDIIASFLLKNDTLFNRL